MDLRNWEIDVNGTALVGADVYVYEASLAHPNANALISQTTTNTSGMWAFTGLTNTAKDVKVVNQATSKQKWYKGMTRHSTGIVFADEEILTDYLNLIGQASFAAPGAATGRGVFGFKTDGRLYGRYENGSEFLSGSAGIACDAIRSAALTVSDNTLTDVPLTAADNDDVTAMHDPAGANPERVIVATPGLYWVQGDITWAFTASTAQKRTYIYKNTTPVSQVTEIGSATISDQIVTATVIRMAAADYFKLVAYQNTGGNLNTSGNPRLTCFWIGS